MDIEILRRAQAAMFVDKIVQRAAREFDLPFTYISQNRGQHILKSDGELQHYTMISTNGQMVNFLTRENYDINWRHQDHFTMYGEQELIQSRDSESFMQENAEEVLARVGQNLLMRSLGASKLSSFDQKFLRLATDPDVRDIGVLSYLGEMDRKIQQELRAEEAIAELGYQPTDKVELQVDVTQATFSNQWNRYYYKGIAEQTQPIRWSSARRMAKPNDVIKIRGRVRAIQDNTLILNYVKEIKT